MVSKIETYSALFINKDLMTPNCKIIMQMLHPRKNKNYANAPIDNLGTSIRW